MKDSTSSSILSLKVFSYSPFEPALWFILHPSLNESPSQLHIFSAVVVIMVTIVHSSHNDTEPLAFHMTMANTTQQTLEKHCTMHPACLLLLELQASM